MNSKERMVAEIILKEVQRIGEIKRDGIIIQCNEDKIAEFLNTKETTKEDLVSLRNLLVERLADRIENWRDLIEARGLNKEADYKRIDEEHAIMTVVTSIIDRELYLR